MGERKGEREGEKQARGGEGRSTEHSAPCWPCFGVTLCSGKRGCLWTPPTCVADLGVGTALLLEASPRLPQLQAEARGQGRAVWSGAVPRPASRPPLRTTDPCPCHGCAALEPGSGLQVPQASCSVGWESVFPVLLGKAPAAVQGRHLRTPGWPLQPRDCQLVGVMVMAVMVHCCELRVLSLPLCLSGHRSLPSLISATPAGTASSCGPGPWQGLLALFLARRGLPSPRRCPLGGLGVILVFSDLAHCVHASGSFRQGH